MPTFNVPVTVPPGKVQLVKDALLKYGEFRRNSDGDPVFLKKDASEVLIPDNKLLEVWVHQQLRQMVGRFTEAAAKAAVQLGPDADSSDDPTFP